MIFHNEINVKPLPNGKHWITKDWVAVFISKYGLIFIPKKFETDFGTIPRILWTIVGAPATGKHRRAVLFHDWIYSTQQCSRKEADDICLDIMKFDKVTIAKQYLIYLAVRGIGFIAWNSKTKASKDKYIEMQKFQFAKNSLQETRSIFA